MKASFHPARKYGFALAKGALDSARWAIRMRCFVNFSEGTRL